MSYFWHSLNCCVLLIEDLNAATDITNVNCSSTLLHCCRSWNAQAWKLLGNVHMYPSQRPICAQRVYKLEYCLYTGILLGYWRCIHAWAQAWAHVYISKQFPSLGTPTLQQCLNKKWSLATSRTTNKKKYGTIGTTYCYINIIILIKYAEYV